MPMWPGVCVCVWYVHVRVEGGREEDLCRDLSHAGIQVFQQVKKGGSTGNAGNGTFFVPRSTSIQLRACWAQRGDQRTRYFPLYTHQRVHLHQGCQSPGGTLETPRITPHFQTTEIPSPGQKSCFRGWPHWRPRFRPQISRRFLTWIWKSYTPGKHDVGRLRYFGRKIMNGIYIYRQIPCGVCLLHGHCNQCRINPSKVNEVRV